MNCLDLGAKIWHHIMRYDRWFLVFPLMVIGLLTRFMQVDTHLTGNHFGLDASWFVELGYQLDEGNLLGRDIFFTYGPLAQLISWAGYKLQGGNVLSGFSVGLLLFDALGLVLLYFVVCLVDDLAWHDAVVIYVLMYLLNAYYARPMLILLCCVVLLRALAAKRQWRYMWAGATGLLCFASQLISMDVGVLALLTCAGVLSLWLIVSVLFRARISVFRIVEAPIEYAKVAAIVVGCYLILYGLLEIYFRLSSPDYRWFDYWRYGVKTLSRYGYAMALDWMYGYPGGAALTAVLLAVAVFCLFIVVGKFSEGIRGGNLSMGYVFSGLLIASIISFKSALTRSDIGHVLNSILALMFLFSLSLTTIRQSPKALMAGVVLLMLVLTVWPVNGADSIRIWIDLLIRQQSLVVKWRDIRAMRINSSEIVPDGLDGALDLNKRLVSFPYNNALVLALNGYSFPPVLQTYAAFDTRLQDMYVKKLADHAKDVEVVFGVDGVNSASLDGVQNVARVPIIFEYLAENFALKTPESFGGYLVLHPRGQPLPFRESRVEYDVAQVSEIGLDITFPGSLECDLLELQLEINYPVFTVLGRPNDLVVQAKNQSQVIYDGRLVAIETGAPFSTFLYLGPPQNFGYLFSSDRSGAPTVYFDKLMLFTGPTSLFDVQPSKLKVDDVICIR